MLSTIGCNCAQVKTVKNHKNTNNNKNDKHNVCALCTQHTVIMLRSDTCTESKRYTLLLDLSCHRRCCIPSADAAVLLPGIQAKNARYNIHFKWKHQQQTAHWNGWFSSIGSNAKCLSCCEHWAHQTNACTMRVRAHTHIWCTQFKSIDISINAMPSTSIVNTVPHLAIKHCTDVQLTFIPFSCVLTATNYVLVHTAKLKTTKNIYGKLIGICQTTSQPAFRRNTTQQKPFHLLMISRLLPCFWYDLFSLSSQPHYFQVSIRANCIRDARSDFVCKTDDWNAINLKLTFKSLLWSVALYSHAYSVPMVYVHVEAIEFRVAKRISR